MRNCWNSNVKRLKTLTLIALPLVLGACSGSIGSVEPPKLAPPPEALTEPCARPVLLPERELSQREVELFWLRDRANLIECGQYKDLLEEFYRTRDTGIGGEQNG